MNESEPLEALAKHPFLRNLERRLVEGIVSCARAVKFPPGSLLCQEDESADAFYLIQSGRVALEVHLPGRGSVCIQSVGPGEVVGWSWFLPPHRWHFDARAIEEVDALVLDAVCLRGKCDANHELGYQLLRRLLGVVSSRLAATRLQLLDVYR